MPACLLTSVWPYTYCVSVGVNGLPPTPCAWSQCGVAITFCEPLESHNLTNQRASLRPHPTLKTRYSRPQSHKRLLGTMYVEQQVHGNSVGVSWCFCSSESLNQTEPIIHLSRPALGYLVDWWGTVGSTVPREG